MPDVIGHLPALGAVAFAVAAAVAGIAVDRLLSRRPRPPELATASASVTGRSPAGVVASGIASGVQLASDMGRCPEGALAIESRPGSAEAMEAALVCLAKSGDACVALALSPLAGPGDLLAVAFGRRRLAWVDGQGGSAAAADNADVRAGIAPKGSLVLAVAGGCRVGPFPVWSGSDPSTVMSRLGELDGAAAATALRLRCVKRSFS